MFFERIHRQFWETFLLYFLSSFLMLLPNFKPLPNQNPISPEEKAIKECISHITEFLEFQSEKEFILAYLMIDLAENFPNHQDRYYQTFLQTDYIEHNVQMNHHRANAFKAFGELLCLQLKRG